MSQSSTAVGEWVQMRVLVTVKAYPSISTKYGEAICVAGIRLDTPLPEWVRLFPVAYRDLPEAQRFQKYEAITLRARTHSTDRRAETWRPDIAASRAQGRRVRAVAGSGASRASTRHSRDA